MKKGDYFFSGCPIPFPTTDFRAWGIRAVDGDTAVSKLDVAFFDEKTLDFRFSDIDCWEKNEGPLWARKLGKEAELFTHSSVAQKWHQIHTQMDQEKYGRILGRYIVPWEPWHNIKTTTEYIYLADALRANGFEKDPSRL